MVNSYLFLRLIFTNASYSACFVSKFCSAIFCRLNSSNSFSVAEVWMSNGCESFSSGNTTKFKSGLLCVNGVHGPWIDGFSVCHIFRKRNALEFPFWPRSKSTHLMISSFEWPRQFIQCRSPFTAILMLRLKKVEDVNFKITNNIRLPLQVLCVVWAWRTRQRLDWILRNQSNCFRESPWREEFYVSWNT